MQDKIKLAQDTVVYTPILNFIENHSLVMNVNKKIDKQTDTAFLSRVHFINFSVNIKRGRV
jgi:hypothetical protein